MARTFTIAGFGVTDKYRQELVDARDIGKTRIFGTGLANFLWIIFAGIWMHFLILLLVLLFVLLLLAFLLVSLISGWLKFALHL